MPARTDATTRDTGGPSVGFASLRAVEVRELLRAAVALRLDEMLTEAEYQAKRRQLAAVR